MRQFLFAASLALAATSCAQLPAVYNVAGEVQHDASVNLIELSVELHDPRQHQIIGRVPVMYDGSFEFRNVATGNYEVRLVNRYGDAIRSEYVNFNQGSGSVLFRIHDPTRKAINGAVSVLELKHHANPKALREFQIAAKASAKGDFAASTVHLERSIKADPQFAPAHVQLGVVLLNDGTPEQALAEFRTAVELDPALTLAHSNLAIVLLKMSRFSEAEGAARRAIQLDPGLVKAHYVLALSLLRQQKYGRELVQNLRLAQDEYPQARALTSALEEKLAAAH